MRPEPRRAVGLPAQAGPPHDHAGDEGGAAPGVYRTDVAASARACTKQRGRRRRAPPITCRFAMRRSTSVREAGSSRLRFRACVRHTVASLPWDSSSRRVEPSTAPAAPRAWVGAREGGIATREASKGPGAARSRGRGPSSSVPAPEHAARIRSTAAPMPGVLGFAPQQPGLRLVIAISKEAIPLVGVHPRLDAAQHHPQACANILQRIGKRVRQDLPGIERNPVPASAIRRWRDGAGA